MHKQNTKLKQNSKRLRYELTKNENTAGLTLISLLRSRYSGRHVTLLPN